MRITKRIEDYIRREVEHKAYTTPELQLLKEKSDAAKERYYEKVQQIRNAAKLAYEALLLELNIHYEGSKEFSMHGYFSPDDRLPECIAYNQARSKMREQIRATIEEILITMEMGGDKNTLNDLLEAVHFE